MKLGPIEEATTTLTPKLLEAVVYMDSIVRESLDSGKVNCERTIFYQKNTNLILLTLFESWI